MHLHITILKMLPKTLIAIWQTLCQNYSRQQLPVTVWHFDLMCAAVCWPVSESGTENILPSDSSSESPRPPWWFLQVKNRTDFGSAQNTQLLEVFFARTELLALPGVDSLSFLVGQKKKGKPRSSSVGVRDFCSLPAAGPSSPVAEQFKHLRTI